MNDHYFSPSPASPGDERVREYAALGHTFRVVTDAGVFSKGGLDAGSALMLKSLPALHGRVLDLGCGWGAIGLALAKANPRARFVLSDVNERAVKLCARNIRENGVHNAEAVLSDGFAAIDGTFDAVVTNPPIRAGKPLVYRLLEDGCRHLNAGGALYAVIRRQQGAASAERFLSSLSGDAARIARGKGYWILRCGRGEQA